MKGTLAFDIDGTLTDQPLSLPGCVIKKLAQWSKDWKIVLITGRPFLYANKAISSLPFPFILGVQNGSDIIKMPEAKSIGKSYVDRSVLTTLETIYQDYDESFFIYSGFEKGDYCYYRPHLHSQEILDYVKQVTLKTGLPWKAIRSFDEIPETSFPLIKCVGKRSVLESIAKKLENDPSLNLSQVVEPIFPQYDLLLINDKRADKGKTISWLIKERSLPRPLIAAGDDNNDIPMMQVADFAIGMEGGAKRVEDHVDLMIAFAQGKGLIEGVEKGMKHVL